MKPEVRAWIESLINQVASLGYGEHPSYQEQEDGGLHVFLPDIDDCYGGLLAFPANFTPPPFTQEVQPQ